MKTNFTSFPRNNFKLIALALFSLLLVNCSKDDDGPETFEFKEFEDLSELAAVTDPDPEFSEPNLGTVKASETTQAMVNDFQDGSGDLSATTKSNINSADNFASGLTTNINDEAQALDAAKIEELLNASSLSGDYAALGAELETLPAEIAALFPTIQLSADYNRAQEQLKTGIVFNNIVSQSNATGPCFDAALAAFNTAMETPIAQKEEQLTRIAANFASRNIAADSRKSSRLAELNGLLTTYRDDIDGSAVAILTYANSIADTDAELSSKLRVFALLYVVKSASLINTFAAEATSLINDTLASEKAAIEANRVAKNSEIETNFAVIKTEADALLTAAYAKCHNQGSGS